ncbi:hypothetical protein [Anaerostipes faecalis]|uniref:hypothetical protein n=1 Tax=Anaerostipes faecalis TaxID=2738446 RepID=UPI003F0DAEC5
MFEDGVCPILKSDAVKKYNLTDDFINKFCSKGCSVQCGKFLKEEIRKKEKDYEEQRKIQRRNFKTKHKFL